MIVAQTTFNRDLKLKANGTVVDCRRRKHVDDITYELHAETDGFLLCWLDPIREVWGERQLPGDTKIWASTQWVDVKSVSVAK